MASLCELLLGNNITNIKSEDLLAFFEIEQEETALLEFKSGEVKLESIYKEVSAFANSEGGVLVIGAPREEEVDREGAMFRICKGRLTDSSFKSKDWLMQKIASHIVPFPLGIRIQQVKGTDGKQFVVEVPQSQSPPHQVVDEGRYFFRLEREAKPAPHGLVQALFNKRKVPRLVASFESTITDNTGDHIRLSVMNDSPNPADDVHFFITVLNVDGVTPIHGTHASMVQGMTQYTFHDQAPCPLIATIGASPQFTIRHKMNPYMVSISMWSMDAPFDSRSWCFHPLTRNVLFEGGEQERASLIQKLAALVKK